MSEERGESREARNASHEAPSSTGLAPRTASALSYLAGPFSGGLILFAESANQDVRFHAWQSVIALGGLGLAVVVSFILAAFALFASATLAMVLVMVGYVISTALLVVWAVCLWMALAGGRWKLPLAGSYAERLALTTPRGRAAS
jgi:uncharacterized membrane protein